MVCDRRERECVREREREWCARGESGVRERESGVREERERESGVR